MGISTGQYRQSFLNSEIADEILGQLQAMEIDPRYITKSSYTPESDTDISFTDKHFAYISLHPLVKPRDYMANLRLKTKVR